MCAHKFLGDFAWLFWRIYCLPLGTVCFIGPPDEWACLITSFLINRFLEFPGSVESGSYTVH